MKFIFLAFFFILFAEPLDFIQDIRIHFQEAEKNKEAADVFNKIIQKEQVIDENLKLAYYGASLTLIAKHNTNVSDKISFFNEGKNKIEEAVENAPNNTEIRLIRLVIQSNTPPILKYRSNIENDKKWILNNYSTSSAGLREYIRNIAQNTDVFSAEEKLSLK